MTDPVRPADTEARDLARAIATSARHGALGVIDPATGGPSVTRVAVGWSAGAPLILVSALSAHTTALAANPACALLLGEVGERGDPLIHPRLTLQARAVPADKGSAREAWLQDHPKSTLYFDFADFRLLRLEIVKAFLNGGFGKAWTLGPADLA